MSGSEYVDCRLHLRSEHDGWYVEVAGDLDVASLPIVDLVLRELPRDAPVVLDLAEARFIGVRALGWMVRQQQDRRSAGGALEVCRVPPRLREIVAVAGPDLEVAER